MSHPRVILEEPVLVGDSVQFLAHVRDFAGNMSDPSSGGFIVYDSALAVVANLEHIKDSTGNYHADWQCPMGQGIGFYYIEYFGVMEGKVHRRRAQFRVVFA